MLRISKLTDYAIVVLTRMAQEPQGRHNAARLAADVRIAPPTVSKILKQLTRGKLVVSYRGAHGGYALSRSPEAISVADVIDAMEGPISLTECAEATGNCAQEPVCSVRGNWQWINRAIRVALESVTLAEMVCDSEGAPATLQDFRGRLTEVGV